VPNLTPIDAVVHPLWGKIKTKKIILILAELPVIKIKQHNYMQYNYM